MPIFTPKYFSIVFIGRQNPQILNHLFLVQHKILPVRREPFRSLIKNSSKEKPPYTGYLSTPVVTTLTYQWVSLIVEENRFQIKDTNIKIPAKSPIIQITKKYFGELLRYTPFTVGGINFSGTLAFMNGKDERDFDNSLGIDAKRFRSYIDTSAVRYSSKINFLWDGDQIEFRVNKPKEGQKNSNLNFNFEFAYRDIDSFIGKLDETDRVYKKFNRILKQLNVEEKDA